MSTLIIVGYEGRDQPSEVLNTLRSVEQASLLDLEDAVAVARHENGKLMILPETD